MEVPEHVHNICIVKLKIPQSFSLKILKKILSPRCCSSFHELVWYIDTSRL